MTSICDIDILNFEEMIRRQQATEYSVYHVGQEMSIGKNIF